MKIEVIALELLLCPIMCVYLYKGVSLKRIRKIYRKTLKIKIDRFHEMNNRNSYFEIKFLD